MNDSSDKPAFIPIHPAPAVTPKETVVGPFTPIPAKDAAKAPLLAGAGSEDVTKSTGITPAAPAAPQ
jgi:hypothetical protein